MKVLIAMMTFLATLAHSAPQPVAIPPGSDLAPGEAGRVVVLMYHHLAPPDERTEEQGVITPERFESHLAMLRAEGYNLINAADFGAFLDGAIALPDRSVLITFDDGYASNYHHGLPLLQKYRAPALIFPVLKYFDTEGKGAYSPHLTREQAATMLASGLVTFGSHTYDGHGIVSANADGSVTGPFLTTKMWLPEQGRQETDEEFLARLRADGEKAVTTLHSLGVTDPWLHFAAPYGFGAHEHAWLFRSLGFTYIYTIDDAKPNQAGQTDLVYRVDGGNPHMSAEALKARLAQLFGE